MDQLRRAFGWLKRHHFWVLVVAAAAIAVGCWYSGANALSGETKRNIQTIQAEFAKQKSLRDEQFHATSTTTISATIFPSCLKSWVPWR